MGACHAAGRARHPHCRGRMEHPAGWELPWSAGRPQEDAFSSGETIFDELVFGELQPGLLVDEPGSGFRFDEPPAEQLLQGPPEELPSPARSEPGTPPPSPVRPASLSDSPAEASRRKRRRDEDDANVDAVFTAATQRPLTVDEVATLLTAPPASLQLTSRPEAGTQPWALHVECSREPRKFGRQTVRATPSPHSINEVQVNPADDLTDTGGRIPHRTSGATAGERRGPLSCARPTRACRRSPGATASCAAAPRAPRCVSMSMPFPALRCASSTRCRRGNAKVCAVGTGEASRSANKIFMFQPAPGKATRTQASPAQRRRAQCVRAPQLSAGGPSLGQRS